jgi:hypothetical protein
LKSDVNIGNPRLFYVSVWIGSEGSLEWSTSLRSGEEKSINPKELEICGISTSDFDILLAVYYITPTCFDHKNNTRISTA